MAKHLRTIPLTLKQANALIAELHRHHKPVHAHRFSIGAEQPETGRLVGAAVVARPVARKSNPYRIAEIKRLVTDGTHNACSFLLGACARISKAMGYLKIQTFILESESGTSLKAAGWTCEGLKKHNPSRWQKTRDGRGEIAVPQEKRVKWSKNLT